MWRWIDRLHGGKSHDDPEKNWKEYVACLTNYPNAPHQTGDWFEDDTSSPLLSRLQRKDGDGRRCKKHGLIHQNGGYTSCVYEDGAETTI
jgi:hypothetical protein